MTLNATTRQNLIVMLNQLEASQLAVALAPSRRQPKNDWDMIRVCVDVNCAWYRKFCLRHPSSRGVRKGKFDTRIKRRNTLRALRKMVDGIPAGKYEDDLARIAKSFTV